MMAYFLTVVITAIVVWLGTLICFRWHIEISSENNKGTVLNGKTYFFMTQDQIQKAVKAVYLIERHNGKKVLCFQQWYENDPKARLFPSFGPSEDYQNEIVLEEIMDLQSYTWDQAVKLQRIGLKK